MNTRPTPPTPPSRLYKYEPISIRTLSNLKAQQIYFGSPREFNDPYDCALKPRLVMPLASDVERLRAELIQKTSDAPKEARASFEAISTNDLRSYFIAKATENLAKYIEEFLDNRGVTCFSEINNNPLMWAHYADKSRGICLEFDSSMPPFGKVLQVEYPKEVPTLDVTSMLFGQGAQDILRLFCTKSSDWAYEREWRGIHDIRGTLFGYDSKCLTGVYFGPRTPRELVEIVCLILRGQNETVQFFKGTRNDSEFKVEFTPITYKSRLEAMRARSAQ